MIRMDNFTSQKGVKGVMDEKFTSIFYSQVVDGGSD